MRQPHSAAETRFASALKERRGAMFPLMLAGLVAVWALGWGVTAHHMSHQPETAETTPQTNRVFINCVPAAAPQPGVLLRCLVRVTANRPLPI